MTQSLRHSDDSQQNRALIHAQIAENARSVPASVAGNLINLVVCGGMLAYYGTISVATGFVVLIALAALIFWRFRTARDVLASEPNDPRIKTWERRILLMAGFLGSFWGLITCLVLSSCIHAMELVGGIIGAGMMSAGSIAFRTLRKAALSYVLCCAIGGVIGLLTIAEIGAYVGLVLMACYLLVLYSNITANAERFEQSWWREQHLAEAADTIQLLLTDLTEQGTEMLLEVDHLGRIEKPCAKMAALFECAIEDLSGTPFGRLLDEGTERMRLKQNFRDGKIIRRNQLALTVNGQRKWISLSARPKAGGSKGYRGVITDLTAQRSAEDRVNFLAHYDALTKLPNRMLFNDNVAHALKRHNGQIAILYLDLDNFKTINDTLGHPVGDRVLAEVARRIEAAIGQYDVASRFGGDEFVILVSGTRVDKIDHLAARIVKDLAAPVMIDQLEIETGASIGMASGPHDGESADCLIRRADLALYAAKSQGRGRAVRFETGMDEAAQARRSVEIDLRGAIRNGELQLHYQPLMDVDSTTVSGFEALVRWAHPERGLIMPNSFIPIAEETGLILPLGEWVIRQAMADAATWPEPLSVSINLSPVQFRSPSLISTLVQALASNGLSPNRVCLEITESVLMHDSEANLELLHKMHELGLQISLDDFGTGYSSLNYLRSFPFDKIKIDRCFISEIEDNADCQAIVRSVITLADSLGMTTIAEGVERSSQAELLQKEGCAELQGFLFSKAVPAAELGRYFAQRHVGVAAAA